jgi:hypothetical protein
MGSRLLDQASKLPTPNPDPIWTANVRHMVFTKRKSYLMPLVELADKAEIIMSTNTRNTVGIVFLAIFLLISKSSFYFFN